MILLSAVVAFISKDIKKEFFLIFQIILTIDIIMTRVKLELQLLVENVLQLQTFLNFSNVFRSLRHFTYLKQFRFSC